MKIEFKNTTVYFKTFGNGKAVVLLHGFLETSEMWQPFISELSKNHQIIIIDVLGHGKTGSISKTHSMSLMARTVNKVLKSLNIKKASMIGHSMGGYVALAFAEKYPEKIIDLCLMNSTFEADDDQKKQIRLRAVNMATNHYENLVRLSFINLFSEESQKNFKTEINKALTTALDTSVKGFIAAQNGMLLRPDRFHIFKNIAGKKLMILGQKDNLINHLHIKTKVKETDINITELSQGHMSHIEHKTELLEAIKNFLKN